MADIITTLPSQKMSRHKLVNQINTGERIETRANYRSLISDLYINRPEYIEPEDDQLFDRLNICNALFKDVRTPREGLLDIVALKTISSFARTQTIAIDNKTTTEDAFKLIRKCAKIIKNKTKESDDVFTEFYMDFCHCHKVVGMMNFMSGRLPTFWFEKRSLEKSLMAPRTRRIKDIIDLSQHTQIKEIKKMSSDGEQTSKEIIRIKRCLEEAYENNNHQPISFFMFTIHPTLFSRSVENIFHISFLIKEGKVELFLDNNQLPVLRPLNKPNTQNDSNMDIDLSSSNTKSNQIHSLTQLILSLDMEQWETLVQTNMSAGIMPDMYRHTARKSTVSKNVKPSNLSLCNNNNNSTTHYSTYHNDNNNSKQQTIFNTIECNIKLEKDIPQQEESFIILRDNEIEQMIMGEDIEQTNEEIIYDIIEQIINQIIQSSSNIFISNSNQIIRTLSIDTQDAHNVIGSIMNHFNEMENKEFLSTIVDNQIEDNVNTNSDGITSMESDQETSIVSRSQMDDDVVEIEAISSNDNPHICTCQCHKPNPPVNNEYLLFEQALKQTRLEQQQEKSLNNNRLIQTLKRQHDELMNIYKQNQNQKQLNVTKIDREQQTIKLHLHDSQIQTDVPTINNSKISSQQQQQQKCLVIPIMNSHNTNNNGSLTATRNHSAFNNSIQTSSSSSLQQIIPRLSANAIATTTITNKTSTITTKTAIVTNSQATPLPPPSTAVPHDIVDLTEEDEDDNNSRVPTQRTTPIRQSTSSIHPPTPSTVATATPTRIRPTNRAIRPNSVVPNGQTFPLRPLPEHIPCDHTIARPQLSISQENATVRLTWNLQSTPMESIQNYEIYAYKQNATATASDWKKIGTVKSMRLPMAVTLKEFQCNSHYAFAVRAVSINNNIGPFCDPKTIFTGSTPVQPLHTSQLLNVST